MITLIDEHTREKYEVNDLDDVRGPIVEYVESGERYHIRELIEYAKEKGVATTELTQYEINKFKYYVKNNHS